MVQEKAGKTVYFIGSMADYYWATSENSNDAVAVTLAKLENGNYTLKLADGKYLAIVASGTHFNAVMQETACEWTWNAKLGNFTVTISGTEYFLGTRNDKTYTTIGASAISYAGSSYQAHLVAPLAHTCESVCPICKGCLDAECTEAACTTKCTCPPPHECESVCPLCEGCTDSQCTEKVCATKCECIIVNVSDLADETVAANKVLAEGSLTLLATESKTVIIEEKGGKEIDGFTFTKRMKLGGGMGEDNRALKLEVQGPCTVVLYAVSSSDKEGNERVLLIKDSTHTTIDQKDIGLAIHKVEIEISEAGTYYLGSQTSGINIYYIAISYKPEAPATQTITYNFETSSTAKGTKLTNETALELFNKSTTSTDLVSVAATNVYDGNGNGGAYPNQPGFIRAGKSGEDGQLVLTLGEGQKVVKVEIKCHDWYKKNDSNPTNKNKIAVNGGTAVLAPYNETGTAEVLTFELDGTSNVVTIDVSERAFIFEIVVTYAE